MKNKPAYREPVSVALRRYPQGDKTEVASTVRWAAVASLFLFLALIVISLLAGHNREAFIAGVGLIPILLAIRSSNKGAVTWPITILAVTLILLITAFATLGQGIHDIAILGYPVILIVTGLILRGRVVMNLSFFIIACIGWLVFGDYFGWYQAEPINPGDPQDFFITSIIILIAGNSVYRLIKNVYQNLQQAEKEIEMREKVETEREQLIHQLQLKNQELDRFAVRVSHDLKTPLITVAGFLGYLEKDIKTGNIERVEKDLVQINEAAKMMGIFVDELLDLSRVGRIINPPTRVSFDGIVQDALKAADGLLKAKQVQVEVEAPFPMVHVDRARLVQVMQNLITNAVKFMGHQPQPKIRIGCEELNGEHVFLVSDNGIGIEPAHHELIFGLFTKLDSNTDGTGIGLGLVKKIIEVHHGRIWVESEAGNGSTFKFTLAHPPGING